MVIVKTVLDNGTKVTINLEVLAEPCAPFPAAGEYLGDFVLTFESGTIAGTIAGAIRQEVARIYEDAIRGAELKRNLSVMELDPNWPRGPVKLHP
jgi:hypothetical protein